ncbi:hypothetical protein O181_023986 [Austropuccinia psidii MF-1]|uniref:Uncharacterized protein n=1 Tax=Austropuccinia psidii MF-1 TaxID=1389203 RepID=A0A9Q3GY65_9BASI|nr:hypothetical protein [Austropuccinia psidii MF-1]
MIFCLQCQPDAAYENPYLLCTHSVATAANFCNENYFDLQKTVPNLSQFSLYSPPLSLFIKTLCPGSAMTLWLQTLKLWSDHFFFYLNHIIFSLHLLHSFQSNPFFFTSLRPSFLQMFLHPMDTNTPTNTFASSASPLGPEIQKILVTILEFQETITSSISTLKHDVDKLKLSPDVPKENQNKTSKFVEKIPPSSQNSILKKVNGRAQ